MTEVMRFCPNCGSTSVEPDTALNKALGGIGDTNTWRCNNCDFSGPIPQGKTGQDTEEDGEVEFEDKPEEYSRINTVKNFNLDIILTLGFAALLLLIVVLDKLV